MEIFHHFGIRIASEAEAQVFSSIGIHLEHGPKNLPGSHIASFEISEDAPQWIEAKLLAERVKITEFVRTEFSESELGVADDLCMLASSHRGYPEPSDKLGYLKATYDLSDFCAKCGIGARQIRPFRLKSAPNLRLAVLQLNWVFDEFFVDRDVWARTFEPFGIGYLPVLAHKTGSELASIVQLQILQQADLEMDEASNILCSNCGRGKTPLSLKGFAPAPTSVPAPIFRSTQYFGSDAGAFNRVFVSAALFKEIRRTNLRGVEFYPCFMPVP
jgi:hypothetical protein